MRARYKLPPEFIAAHQSILDAWDWERQPEMKLAETIPNEGFEPSDALEAIPRHGSIVVRSRLSGTMRRVRNYADRLPATEKPSLETVAAILAKRNPEKPE